MRHDSEHFPRRAEPIDAVSEPFDRKRSGGSGDGDGFELFRYHLHGFKDTAGKKFFKRKKTEAENFHLPASVQKGADSTLARLSLAHQLPINLVLGTRGRVGGGLALTAFLS